MKEEEVDDELILEREEEELELEELEELEEEEVEAPLEELFVLLVPKLVVVVAIGACACFNCA